ncbi:Mak16 protein, partial [Neoconidiobolus thromboides FSU 785]
MNNEEIIWNIVNTRFCSYKVSTDTQKFCRNEYNVTGLCDRESCPLANSRYATVREQEGTVYLFIKTAERAHLPAKLWEKIKLDKNLIKAIEQIDQQLLYWPEKQINKCKLRLTKIKQYLIKMRKLKLKNQPKLVVINKKVERREKKRETKAEAAAKLENNIEKELLNRLKNKAYGEEPLNINEAVWKKILEGEQMDIEDELSEEDEEEEELEMESEFVEGISESEEEFEDLFENGHMGNVSDDSDIEESEEESEGDIELDNSDDNEDDDSEDDDKIDKSKMGDKRKNLDTKKSNKKKKKRGAYVEIEYENEEV